MAYPGAPSCEQEEGEGDKYPKVLDQDLLQWVAQFRKLRAQSAYKIVGLKRLEIQDTISLKGTLRRGRYDGLSLAERAAQKGNEATAQPQLLKHSHQQAHQQ